MDLQAVPNRTAFFNGEHLPIEDVHISPFDRGYLFGDSVYEAMPIYNQKALGETEHYNRLLIGLEKAGIKSPYTVEEWSEKLTPLFSKDNDAELLYIQVSRGVEPARKHRFPVNVEPTVFAFVMPITPPITLDYEGCDAHLLADLRWQRCDIKSASLMGNVLSYRELYLKGVANDEALLTRTDGKNTNVVEAPSSNVFAVVDGVIITPPLGNILAGVTRNMVVDDAKRLGLPLVEAPLSVENIKQASEVWVTNSYEELKPIIRIDGEVVGDGKTGDVWKQLFQAYQERKA